MRNMHPSKLHGIAGKLQSLGEGEDKILAHINPEEADLLSRRFGYDINPETGLPQFGFFRHPRRTLQKVLPFLGGGLGFMLAGPAGAAVGAGLGRALPRRDNFLRNFGQGALVGGGLGFGAQAIGTAAGIPALQGGQGLFNLIPGMAGQAPGGLTGGISPLVSMLSRNQQPQQPQAPQIGQVDQNGNIVGMEQMMLPYQQQQQQIQHQQQQQSGLLSQLVDSLGGPLNAGLGATAIAGLLTDKKKVSREQREHERDNLKQISDLPIGELTGNSNRWGPEYQARRVKPLRRKYINPTPENSLFYEDVNPETEYYASGGHVGYIDGDSGGQDDDVDVHIPEGSYVMDATTVSLLGDGNSIKGAKEIKRMEDTFMKSGIVRNPKESNRVRAIHAKVSPGEYTIMPETVDAIGKGNNRKGSKVLDKMRNNLRSQKGVKKFLPPKSKPIHSYMR